MKPLDYYTILEIEENNCVTCRFRKNPEEDGDHALEFPMCYEIEAAWCVGDDDIPALDMTDTGVVVCRKHKPGDPWETFGAHPDQLELF